MTQALILLIAASQTAQAPLTLDVQGKHFVIGDGGKIHREPIEVTPKKESSQVIYRKDDKYAVWDSRGLSVRKGKQALTNRLVDIALTPKLFSREEIIETKEKIAMGTRSQAASALSGSVRIGDEVFFLARWQEKGVGPWLEALVKVNLTDKTMKPQLVGEFEGFSISNKLADDKLFVLFGLVSALTRKPDGTWGLASYSPASGQFSFTEGGRSLIDYRALSNRIFIVEEKTESGSIMVSRVDFSSGGRRSLMDTKGKVDVLMGLDPLLIRVTSPEEVKLWNADSGATLDVEITSMVRRTPYGILVWPKATPASAVLYEPERWSRLASIKKKP